MCDHNVIFLFLTESNIVTNIIKNKTSWDMEYPVEKSNRDNTCQSLSNHYQCF